jgi:hypothetical protein
MSPGVSRPSLLDIQREEEARKRAQQRAAPPPQPAASAASTKGVWKAPGSVSRPLSLAEIQEEEMKGSASLNSSSGSTGGGGNGGGAPGAKVTYSSVSSSGSSKGAPIATAPAPGEDSFWDYRPSSAAAGPTPAQASATSGSDEQWCRSRVRELTGREDVTLTHFLLALKDKDEIRNFIAEYIGETSAAKAFAEEFAKRVSVKSNSAIAPPKKK